MQPVPDHASPVVAHEHHGVFVTRRQGLDRDDNVLHGGVERREGDACRLAAVSSG